MIKIYHNPRCSKSRQGLEIVKNSGKDFEVVEYLKSPLKESEIKQLINKIGINPIDLVRKNEADWKNNFKGKDLTNSDVIKALAEYPKLIERPIVETEQEAVVGRPPEQINNII